MESVLTPNPGFVTKWFKYTFHNNHFKRSLYNIYAIIGNRIEDFFYEKIDKKKPNRLSNLEYVGMDMIEAGNDFGPGIAYGTLVFSILK